MKIFRFILFLALSIQSAISLADPLTRDSAIGGGLGGAVGAAIGAEIGGRDGAIVGSAVGAAIGTTVATSRSKSPTSKHAYSGRNIDSHPINNGHPNYRHCPPGQAKKGRC